MPCLELRYHWEIPSLTSLAIILNVFESVCSPALCSESVHGSTILTDMMVQEVVNVI